MNTTSWHNELSANGTVIADDHLFYHFLNEINYTDFAIGIKHLHTVLISYRNRLTINQYDFLEKLIHIKKRDILNSLCVYPS